MVVIIVNKMEGQLSRRRGRRHYYVEADIEALQVELVVAGAKVQWVSPEVMKEESQLCGFLKSKSS